IPDRDLGTNQRIDGETIAVGGALDGFRRPGKPTLILRHDVQKDVGVNQNGRHQSSRVSAMMASVLIATSPRPLRCATRRAPRPIFLRTLARTMRTTLPSNSNSTSVCGRSPARSRISAGMVTCPLDVMRMPSSLLLHVRVRNPTPLGKRPPDLV